VFFKLLRTAVLAALVIGASACARLHARTEPPLDVPSPPPRAIVPIENQPIVATPTTPNSEPEPARPPERAPVLVAPAPAPPPKTDRPETAVAPAPAAAEPPKSPRALTTGNATEAEQHARALIAAARRDLARIDPRRLASEPRAQYDTAKRFIDQAEGALRTKNPIFAEQLADKAATLAALLPQR
jgi:hypothetical protein